MASKLDNILGLLARWSEWKAIRDAPGRLDVLQRRIEKLEQKLADRPPTDICRLCGKRAAHFTRAHPGERGHVGSCEFSCLQKRLSLNRRMH